MKSKTLVVEFEDMLEAELYNPDEYGFRAARSLFDGIPCVNINDICPLLHGTIIICPLLHGAITKHETPNITREMAIFQAVG